MRIHELFLERYCIPEPEWRVSNYELSRNGDDVQAVVSIGGAAGLRLRGRGHGVVEALVDALARQRGIKVDVEQFDEHAMDQGTDANAMACVRVRVGDTIDAAVAFGEDTACAALQAVLAATGAAIARGRGTRTLAVGD